MNLQNEKGIEPSFVYNLTYKKRLLRNEYFNF